MTDSIETSESEAAHMSAAELQAIHSKEHEMNLFEIPTAADLRAFAGMPALRAMVATMLYVAQAENDSSEAVIDLEDFDHITTDMIEAVAAEMREKGYTVVVDVDELAVTWGEDLLG